MWPYIAAAIVIVSLAGILIIIGKAEADDLMPPERGSKEV